jgi:enamine deaminase RidA (YjgF/YER057c/UK114 family)
LAAETGPLRATPQTNLPKRIETLNTREDAMRNAIGIACVIAATALVGAAGQTGVTQEQKNIRLAPPQVYQPPFPYSLGFVTQGKRTVYVAGQVSLNEKGELVGKDDPEAQARQVFTNMKGVLAAAGAKMDDVVKITTIIKNGADFPKIGAVRKEFFKEPYPASTAFIAPLLNPDWLVEIEAVALID